MEKDELIHQINVIAGDAIEKGKTDPYPHRKHTALAGRYSEGAKAYYDKQIDILLADASNKSFMAGMWINGGCPNMADAIYTRQIPILYIELLYGKLAFRKSDDDFLNFVKDDLELFFMIYFNYLRLKNDAVKANTKIKYNIPLSIVAEIYDACNPCVVNCGPLEFCNAIYNPDTFCNIQGVKSNLMLFVNLSSKIKGLGVKWKKDVCASMGWAESECSKRSIRDDMSADWCIVLQKMASPHKSRK